MKRAKTIKYIVDTPVEDMVRNAIENKWDINHVIQAALESRKLYGLKVQEFIEKLNYGI